MKKRFLLCTALAAALSVPAIASAQDAAPNTGALHFGADLNFTTSYFFRGYNQEDTGVIFQPNVFATSDIVNSDDLILTAKVGTWNSFQSEHSAGDGDWYECDLYAGLNATFAGNYYAGLLFTYYTYPDNAFDEIQELGVYVGIGDTGKFWDKTEGKMFTMPVEFGLYQETSDKNGDQDVYAEIKATPTFAFSDEFVPSFGKPTLSIPVVLGGSTDGYYTDDDGDHENFGYVSVGATLGLPMKFMPAKYGMWKLNAGVNYIYLIADSAENANDGGTNYELQGMVGVSMTY